MYNKWNLIDSFTKIHLEKFLEALQYMSWLDSDFIPLIILEKTMGLTAVELGVMINALTSSSLAALHEKEGFKGVILRPLFQKNIKEYIKTHPEKASPSELIAGKSTTHLLKKGGGMFLS